MCNFDKEQLAEKLNQPEEYEKLKNKSQMALTLIAVYVMTVKA